MNESRAHVDVSVVMPTWNRPEFLRESIDSVFAQTVVIRELILADDGSEAPTRALLAEYATDSRIRVLWRTHCGNPGAVRNAAIREASGRYVAFVDSDDLWYPEKLARQLDALRARPDCRWSYTSWSGIDAQGRRNARFDDPGARVQSGTLVESLAEFSTEVPLPSVLAERSLLLEAGLFEESLGCYEDYDLWVRLAMLSDAAAVPDPLVKVRLHDRHFSRGHSFAALSGRDRYFARVLRVVQTPAVRARLNRMRALNSARLASIAALAGDAGEATARLRGSLVDGWQQPRWWLVAARAHSRLWTLRARRIWGHP